MNSKRKSVDELVRFVWKRNPKYDLLLLGEVESRNPYAFKDQKQVWTDIANVLQNGTLKMKVSHRSCRERIQELLKSHRREELASIQASGISEVEISEMKVLLISVAKLEEAKPDKQLMALFSRKDLAAAEAVRSQALIEVDDSDSSDDEPRRNMFGETKEEESGEIEDENFEFGPKSKRGKLGGRRGGRRGGRSQHPNPKKDLVDYLERKSEKETTLRKEELRIREREMENKKMELEIMRLKVEAEVEERKKMSELLIKLATSTPPQ